MIMLDRVVSDLVIHTVLILAFILKFKSLDFLVMLGVACQWGLTIPFCRKLLIFLSPMVCTLRCATNINGTENFLPVHWPQIIHNVLEAFALIAW